MKNFYINNATQKFDYLDPETGLITKSVADALKVKSIDMFYDASSGAMLTMETINNGKTRTFSMNPTAFQRPDTLLAALLRNGYFMPAEYSKIMRYYLMHEASMIQQSGQINYKHKSLGLFDDQGDTVFLLEQNKLKLGTSNYYNDNFEFTKGVEKEYQDFLDKEILPNDLTQLALVIGLSSVTSSYLKDYADVGTIVINFSGRSSTGKTTMSHFIASLWANPRISNSGLVKTFNSTEIAKLASIEGYNGIPIIFDDATTLGAGNKSKLIYQLAEGESRARSANYGTEIAQGLQWSGTALITSENPILDDSDVRLGLRARVLDFDNVEWTNDAEHATAIKNFTYANYGHVGKKFAENLLAMNLDDVKSLFDEIQIELDSKLEQKDDITNRITNKLAILLLTAHLVKKLLKYDLNLDSIRDKLVEVDQKDVEERHPSIIALEAIKHYIVRNNRKFEKQDEDGNRLLYSGGELWGVIKFAPNTMEVHIPSKFVKDILRQNRIYDYNVILKAWDERGFIIKQGKRRTANTSKLDTKAVRFIFHRTEDSIIPWDYPLAKHKSTPKDEKTPESKVDYSMTEEEQKKFLEGLDDESKD